MADLHEIVAFLDDLLDATAFADYGPNGVQVPGAPRVERIVTGVSACAELFESAAATGAQAVLVHHGVFWKGAPLALDRPAARRLKLLLDHDISLLSYHLPLDAHPEHGNNALLARAIGAEPSAPFAGGIGVIATFPGDGVAAPDLAGLIRAAVGGREPLAFSDGPDRVRRVGIVTGEGAGHLEEAIAAGLDGLITGEPSERVMHRAREAGIHFVAAGHYATETFGVRRLGDLLADRFALEHVFVDIPNPV